MFDNAFVRGESVVAMPRPGTKTAGPVAFDLNSGVEVDALAAREPSDPSEVRIGYLSSAVGKGPSMLSLYRGNSETPFATAQVPDAISAVAAAPFGWFVGCRDGFYPSPTRATASLASSPTTHAAAEPACHDSQARPRHPHSPRDAHTADRGEALSARSPEWAGRPSFFALVTVMLM